MTKGKLKAAVTAARAGKVRGRFPADLKRAVVEYGRSRRADGASWGKIGGELGLAESQVSAWCSGGRGAPSGRLQPVTIVPDAGAREPATAVTLTLPHGEVVSGLDVASLAALLKALR